MTIKKFHREMSEQIMFDSFMDIPDTFGRLPESFVFNLNYGNFANECTIMAALGISPENVIINVVEMIQAKMTKTQIIYELKSAISETSQFRYFVSIYGTYTLFDTLVANVFELHEMYNSEEFEHEIKNIEFFQYVTDSIIQSVEAKIKSNHRPGIRSYWSENAI